MESKQNYDELELRRKYNFKNKTKMLKLSLPCCAWVENTNLFSKKNIIYVDA